MALFQGVAGQRPDFHAVRVRLAAFLADRLALARGQPGEEIVEGFIAPVVPVKLLSHAPQEPRLAEGLPLVLGAEGNVKGRNPVVLGQLHQPGRQHQPGLLLLRTRPNHEARPGDRCERHRDLQLRVVLPAGTLERIRPAPVEHVLAVGMALQIARHRPDQPALVVLDRKVLRQPARTARNRAALFEDSQEAMRHKGVVRSRAGIPLGRLDLRYIVENLYLYRLAAVGHVRLWDRSDRHPLCEAAAFRTSGSGRDAGRWVGQVRYSRPFDVRAALSAGGRETR